MRLEDLDGPRVKASMAEAALRDLEWLGLDWDGPVLLQSVGAKRFDAVLQVLHQAGRTYPCVCTRSDLRRAQSAPQRGDRELRYPGTCRGRFSDLEQARAVVGREPGVRFVVPSGSVPVRDGFAGEHCFDVAREVGDFLVARRDAEPAYQLAVVVDDARQGVTEVVRGDDLLASTARQILLQQALALPSPRWFHVPLVVDATGRRLAKRTDDLSLTALRRGGTDPRAIVAWAARSSGVDTESRVSAAECLAEFDLGRVSHDPVVVGETTVDELMAAR